jgi:hypothetical protein
LINSHKKEDGERSIAILLIRKDGLNEPYGLNQIMTCPGGRGYAQGAYLRLLCVYQSAGAANGVL